MNTQQLAEQTSVKTTDRLSFGQYRGKSYKWVFNNDAQYLMWCVENIPNFKLPFYYARNSYEKLLERIRQDEKELVRMAHFEMIFSYE